jgi:hypothetical protein
MVRRRRSSSADTADAAVAVAWRWPMITFAIDTADAMTTRARDARRRGEEEDGGPPRPHPRELVLVGMMRVIAGVER